MTAKYAALLGAITIDSSNCDIRFKEAATTATITLDYGTYYLRGNGSTDDLCRIIKEGIEDDSGLGGSNTYAVTVARSIDPSAVSGSVTITQSGGASFQVLWADALTTFDMSLLGYTENTPDSTAAKVSNPARSPAAWWVSPEVPAFYEPGYAYDASVNRARSGRVRGLRRGGPYDTRSVRFNFVDSRRVLSWDNTSDVDATFAAFLERNGDGKAFEFHAAPATGYVLDALTSSVTTRIGTAWHFDEETSTGFDPKRVEPGLTLYGFDLGLMGYTS